MPAPRLAVPPLTALPSALAAAPAAGVEALRARWGSALFDRVGGPDGPRLRERIHHAPGPRRFSADDPIARVHGDASMFIGGLRALLLQSLHPAAMTAVAEHSGYRSDPWGRLQRTAAFIAATTFATERDADHAIAAVRSIHARISGTLDDGTPYAASDPHLLRWVHVAEVDSFLRAYQAYGPAPLSPAEADRYVAQAGVVATALGASDVPHDVDGVAAAIAEFRPELRAVPAAHEVVRHLLWNPPLPLAARPGYGVLAAAAVGLMPLWSRRALRLPWLPIAEPLLVRTAGRAATATIRWVTPAG